jgi:hypothetical protein
MNKEFVSYEMALALKQLGFDEPCLRYYDYFSKLVESGVYECKAPLYQQVFTWFREKYDLDSYIKPACLETKKVYDYYIWFNNKEGERDLFLGMNNEYTYKEAEIECLNKLITTLK